MISCPSCGAPFSPSLPDQVVCDACSGLLPADQSSPLHQAKVGDYTLVHQLGAGRFSTSWLAEPTGGGGVVLKLLRAWAPDTDTVQRFLDEARRLAVPTLFDHPSLARLLEAGVHIGGTLFLVYESGGELTVADELRGRGRVAPARAVELCAQLCEALQQLHQNGVRHLGLKPANVGLATDAAGNETAVLLDAFTAHLLQHAGLREAGMLPIATAAFLSPEEARGEAVDGRADLYSVGVLLYQLISGRLPLMGSSADELIEAHKSQRALRLRDVGRKVHPEFEGVVARLLAKDPAQRFPDGQTAAKALRAVLPVAEQPAPEQEAEDEVEDPVPITGAHDPVVPPEPAVPAGLEQAMLGNVAALTLPPSVPPKEPSASHVTLARRRGQRRRRFLPRWLTPLRAVAALGALVMLSFLLLLFLPDERPSARRRRRNAPPVAAAPAPPPETAPPAPAPVPPEASATVEPVPPPPAPPRPTPPKRTASANGTRLSQLQRRVSQGQGKASIPGLQALLERADLTPVERARATRVMAEAEQRAGDKAAAIDWYRRYLQLTKDPRERTRVIRKIQALGR